MSGLSNKKFNVTKGSYTYKELSYAQTSDESEALSVFKFVTDNSRVEWSLDGYESAGERSYLIGTRHSIKGAINTHSFINGFAYEDKYFDMHSHVLRPFASGYRTPGVPYGDNNRRKIQIKRITSRGGKAPD